MECPHIDDIKEIKKDVKTLLAHHHERQGEEKHSGKIAALVSFLISTTIALIALFIKA